MSEQDTSEVDSDRANSKAQDPSTETDARAEPTRPEAGTASGAREDDRNEELDESPVPDPEATEGDADDDPGAD
jgi:hypothetical protein